MAFSSSASDEAGPNRLRRPRPHHGEPSSPQPAVSGPAASWRDLHADDLKEFIRRLRGGGCPEETVQDLILAEVNRRYAARQRELWPERNGVRPFWEVQKNDPAESKQTRERSRWASDLLK